MTPLMLKLPVLKALRDFKPRPSDAWMLQDPAYVQRLEHQILLFPAYALPNSAAASCLTGLVHSFGVGELWMLTGEGFARDARRILPVARRLLAHHFNALQLRRMEMLIASDHAAGATWARHAGFAREHGPLKSKGARGQDLDIWVFKQNRGEK